MFRLGLHVFFFLLLAAAGAGTIYYLLQNTQPQSAQWWQLGLFYSGALLTGFGLLTLALFGLRRMLRPHGLKPDQWRSSRRQGLLLGLLVILVLVLLALRIFNPLTGLLVVVIFLLIELYVQ